MKVLGLLLCLLLPAVQTPRPVAPASRDAWLQGGRLSLVQEFGRALYSRCILTVYYSQPFSKDIDRVALHCSPNIRPRPDDEFASRKLSVAESASLAKLVTASDLYSGGHVGNYTGVQIGSEGPWESLEVHQCCGRTESAVLITDGNPTFAVGSRRDLRNLLSKWRAELFPKLEEPK